MSMRANFTHIIIFTFEGPSYENNSWSLFGIRKPAYPAIISTALKENGAARFFVCRVRHTYLSQQTTPTRLASFSQPRFPPERPSVMHVVLPILLVNYCTYQPYDALLANRSLSGFITQTEK
jgi:hypothetical protein